MSVQILIVLDEPVTYPMHPELFSSATHAQIVNVKEELARPVEGVAGQVDLWIAFGYQQGGVFYTAPGLPGLNVRIDEPDLGQLTEELEGEAGHAAHEWHKALSHYLIDREHLAGEVVVVLT